MPYFSVVIPVYNAEKYLAECLDSVLGQTFEDFEVILVDDGSTDSSGIICDGYSKKDRRVKVIHHANKGTLLSRQEALKKVCGKYILFLDSDDYWEKQLLQNIYETIKKYNCDIVMFRYKYVDENGTYLYSQRSHLTDKTYISDADRFLMEKFATTFEYNSLCFRAVKRECIDSTINYKKYKDVNKGEDTLQAIEMVRKAKTMVYIDQMLYNYRFNQKGTIRNVSIKDMNACLVVREEILNLLEKEYDMSKDIIIKANCFALRVFFTCLADLAYGGIGKQAWKSCYQQMSKSNVLRKIRQKNGMIKGIALIYNGFLCKQIGPIRLIFT